jgi:two-component system response regulator FixJ
MINSAAVVRIVDDDPSYLAATARMLKAAGYTVQTFTSAEELLPNLGDAAGCVIADLRMPAMDGLDLQQALMRESNALPLIFLTGEGDIPTTVKAMREGAEDFLTKLGPKEAILAAVDRAFARDIFRRAEAERTDALRARVERLTPRELGVLKQVVEGKLNKQIAADLDINERTVKFHRAAITTKLQVRSVAELTKLAQAARLFDEPNDTFPKVQ